MSISPPPSFPPVLATPRPDLEELELEAQDARRARSGWRRRASGLLLALAATTALGLGALELTGLAPWAAEARADLGAPGEEPASTLDARLERSIARAVDAAARDGVELYVSSGLRSAEEQRILWEEALEEHGSRAEAARWVLPPEVSSHVTGKAVDVGPAQGAAWLGEHGSRWGLCQVYANEPWHFERVTRNKGECPAMLPDASVLLED